LSQASRSPAGEPPDFHASLTLIGDHPRMIVNTRRRRILALVAFHSLAWSASAYFLHSAQTGDRGLAAKREAKIRTEEIGREIAEMRAEKQAWERRVSQLSNEKVDRDLIDERNRAMLNVVHRSDVVILLNR
jgi:cell division protein FtsB